MTIQHKVREKKGWRKFKNDQTHEIKITLATTTTFLVYLLYAEFHKTFPNVKSSKSCYKYSLKIFSFIETE